MTFTGGYFQVAKFLHEIDSLVQTGRGGVTVSGRLVTLNSFELSPPSAGAGTTSAPGGSSGTLEADLSVTTYLAPPDEGLTGGATPSGPGPTTPSTAVPTSTPSTALTPTTADTANPAGP